MAENVTGEGGVPLATQAQLEEIKALLGGTSLDLALDKLTQSFASNGANDVGGTNTKLGSLIATNRNAAVRYLLLSKTANATTDANAISIPVAASSTIVRGTDFFGARGWLFGAHFSYVWSTAPAGSYAAATAADHDAVMMGA